jgi:hypothetical protein
MDGVRDGGVTGVVVAVSRKTATIGPPSPPHYRPDKSQQSLILASMTNDEFAGKPMNWRNTRHWATTPGKDRFSLRPAPSSSIRNGQLRPASDPSEQ